MDIKEILGESYLDLNTSITKLQYVNAINKFINRYSNYYPEYSVMDNEPKITDVMKMFIKNKEMTILNYNFFTKQINRDLLSNPYETKCRYYDFMLIRDKYGVNKVIISRAYSNPCEMSAKLGKETLQKLYKMLVLDIIDLKIHNRFLKELDIYIKNNIHNKYTIKCKPSYVTLTKYSDFKYDEKKFTLTIIFKEYSSSIVDALDFNNKKNVSEKQLNFIGLDRIFYFFNSFNNCKLVSTKEELIKIYNSYYDSIINNINKTKNFINDNF